MKKSFLTILVLLSLCFEVQAQQEGLRLGTHIGLPMSDASDVSSFHLGVDASYLFDVTENLAVGAATGYSTFFSKNDFDNYSYVPVAASVRGAFSWSIFYTADLGYAVALEDGAKGGLYYQGKLGWAFGKVDVFGFYKGIFEDDASLDAIGAGVAYKF